MSKTDAKALLSKYHSGTASAEERAIVENWMLHGAAEDLDLSDEELVQDLAEIRQRLGIDQPQKKIVRLWPRIAAAASIILCLSAGGYFIIYKHPAPHIAQNQNNDIKPGGNKAILTLANGKKISLTDANIGRVAVQSGIKITKSSNGQITYSVDNSLVNTDGIAGGYNTTETPIGGQIQVNLPDGTKVWLNAASSLKYPLKFTGKERRVELTGEGYFEVAHNKAQPFRVVSAGQVVEVLGTHFNINVYKDEPVAKTTLLEGVVRIGNNTKIIKVLKPGQQATLNGNVIAVSNADVEQTVAWKNGDFVFEGTPLKTIMRQISRWYNVEISYRGAIAEVEFGGSISRSKNINEVLSVLESTQGVHFKIEGRRILVMP